MDRGETAYTRAQGTVELCEAVQQHLTQLDINVKADDVVITAAGQALFYGMMAVLTPGDEAAAFASLAGPTTAWFDSPVPWIHVLVRRDNYHPDFDAQRNAPGRTPRRSF